MRHLFTFVILALFSYETIAQISTEEYPYSWTRGLDISMKQAIQTVTMPSLDLAKLHAEDLENEGLLAAPARFGFQHDVSLSLSNAGSWQTTSDGGRLWTLKIYSPDALSLNLLYNEFWLPEGAKFFLYSTDKKQHIGAFTSQNNQGNRENIQGFATGLLLTSSIVLEYYEPKEVEKKGIISIDAVVSGYRYISDIAGTRHNLTNLSCHNDIIDPVGSDYQFEKNAIACISMGAHVCTGFLLNTTANDRSPIFLTAEHCLCNARPLTQCVFYWNYEALSVGGVVSPTKSTVGANLKAKNVDKDFCC